MKVSEGGKLRTGIEWHNIAMAAFIMANVEPDEARAPEGVRAGEHLRALIFGETGVNQLRTAELNSELAYAVRRGDISELRWTKSQLRNWLLGVALSSMNYDAIHALIFEDVENENEI